MCVVARWGPVWHRLGEIVSTAQGCIWTLTSGLQPSLVNWPLGCTEQHCAGLTVDTLGTKLKGKNFKFRTWCYLDFPICWKN